MNRTTLFRALVAIAAAGALSACGTLDTLQAMQDKSPPKIGHVKVAELVPGSIPFTQFVGRECGGQLHIAFEDQAGKLHVVRQKHLDFCRLKEGDSISYREVNGNFIVFPTTPNTNAWNLPK